MSVPALLPPPEGGGFRERLILGLAEAIREAGSFHQVTVAEIVRRARTSRRTFYEHFEDREGCFLALFDVVSDSLLNAIAQAGGGEGPWRERVDRAMAAYLGALAAEPAIARSCLQETPSVGPQGTARAWAMNERWARQLVALVEDARASGSDLGPLSMEAAIVITGGFRDLVIAALEQGRELTDLQDVGGELIRRITVRRSDDVAAG